MVKVLLLDKEAAPMKASELFASKTINFAALLSVSVKHKLRTAECRLRTRGKMQTAD